jgi:hypothetical protein
MNRMNPRTLLVLLSGLATSVASSGCATFTRAEIDLVTQTRRGIALIAQHDVDRDRAVLELARLRREKLDDAFDADARDRADQESLDADWVIEARRAYAVAIDAYAKAQAANERSAQVRKQNLTAIIAALDRLQWMQSLRLKLDPFNQETQRQEDQP